MQEKVYIKKKYEDGVMIILFLLLLSFGYFTKDNQSVLEIFITAFFIISGIWFIFFDIERLEKILLGNFTKIIFSLIFILLFTKFSYIEISKEVMYLIGGLFAFWYGFKKYERDKELEILEKYGKKYDELKEKDNYGGILSLCEEEYYLYQKKYISEELWKRIQFKIDENLQLILDKASNEFLRVIKDKKNRDPLNERNKYIELFFDSDIISGWKGFGDYLIGRMEEIKKDREKIVAGELDTDIYELEKMKIKSQEYITLIDTIIPVMRKAIDSNTTHFNN